MRDWAKLDPEFSRRLKLVFHRYKRLYPGENQPFLVEGYRSQERQDELYAQGRTTPGQIVTQLKHSLHTERVAADIAFTQSGYEAMEPFRWFAELAETVGLESGYYWQWRDAPHIQKPRNGYGRILPLDLAGLGIDRVYIDGEETEINLLNQVGSKLYLTVSKYPDKLLSQLQTGAK